MSRAALVRKYARMIQEAANEDADRLNRHLLESVGSDRRSHLIAALVEVSKLLDTVTRDGEPISEEVRQEYARLIAETLGYNKPIRLGRLLREGSVSALLTMSQAIEDLFAAVRK